MSASTPSHKPRKRRRDNLAASSPDFPLVSFLWPARTAFSPWVVLPSILLVAALFRWAVSIWPYSGYQVPPMHGDFEAQRHWMELTTHVPVSQWYWYDLKYWGLDYPPLTAYHSWAIGKIGNFIEPTWFALKTSRGNEDVNLKIFMRASALVSEYLVYIPAVIVGVRWISRLGVVNQWESAIALAAVLMQPATILIDHGHFQYNTVMLGFTAAAMSSLQADRRRWACVFFVAALGFKQMALFYAPVIFAFLLGSCMFPTLRPMRLITIAITTLAAFALLYAPLLVGVARENKLGVKFVDPENHPNLSSGPLLEVVMIQIRQSIHRIFPFARGLFEDKVANVWCAIHTFHKLHQYPQWLVQRAALLATLAAITPPCLIVWLKPKKELVPLAFATTAWGFFLCSYQVHEKNVLLPLLPLTLLLAGKAGLSPTTRAWVGFANLLATWTLFPLLQRDGLRVPYFVLSLLWAYLLGLPPTSISLYWSSAPGKTVDLITALIHVPFYLAMLGWHIVEAFYPPPKDKPDLWVVANVLTGAAGFVICYLWCLMSLLQKAEWWPRDTQSPQIRTEVKTSNAKSSR